MVYYQLLSALVSLIIDKRYLWSVPLTAWVAQRPWGFASLSVDCTASSPEAGAGCCTHGHVLSPARWSSREEGPTPVVLRGVESRWVRLSRHRQR